MNSEIFPHFHVQPREFVEKEFASREVLDFHSRFLRKMTVAINQEISLETELHSLCERLYVVGWMKVRNTRIWGHVQGDAIALMHLKKFLQHGLSQNRTNLFQSCYISDENFGIPEYGYRFFFFLGKLFVSKTGEGI